MATRTRQVTRTAGRHTPFVAQALRAARAGLDDLWRRWWDGDDAGLAGRLHLPAMGRVLQLDIPERRTLAGEHDLLRVLSSLASGGDTASALTTLSSLVDSVAPRALLEGTALSVHALSLRSRDPGAAAEVTEGLSTAAEALERVVAAARDRGHDATVRQALAVHGRVAVASAWAAGAAGGARSEATATAARLAEALGAEERWWGHAFGAATWALEDLLLRRAAGEESAESQGALDRGALSARQLRSLPEPG